MNNALLYIGGFFVVVLASLFAVPHFIDWNSYRGVFEEEASRVLGRDVRIGGAVNLRLLPAPYVSLEKLKIADPSSSTGDSLFRAESFTLWLSVPPLLKGVLEANKIEVRRPVVQLVASPEGGGNWQSLSINAGQMPLIPQGVSLQSVTISEGALVIGTLARPEIARIESINGELTAETLNGPYKFSGSMVTGGLQRDVRVATSAAEPHQDLRFKATVRTLVSGNNYTASGRVSDLDGRAKIEADLTAGLNVTLLSSAQSTAGSVPKSEMTAKLTGDATGVELKDIALTLAQGTTPQLVSGSAKVSWPQRTQIELSLASRWLDFDRLTEGGKAVPVDVARQLFDALASSLPDEADTSTNVMLDQVTLGGDAVSDVRFQASRAGGALELKGVRANLPGGARVEFDGQLTGADAARAFTGTVALSGQSLQRFAAWGTANDGFVDARADGPFSLEGALSLSRSDISIRDAKAEIAGMPLSGEFQASFEGRRKISVVVESDRLDAGAFWPGSLSPDFAAVLLQAPGATAPAPLPIAATPAADAVPAVATAKLQPDDFAPQDMDIRVHLRAAELVDGERVLKNVDADLAIENGALAMPRLNFTTATGLAVELEGETKPSQTDTKAAGPAARTGQVRGTVSAPDSTAIAGLSQALGLGSQDHASSQSLAALAPLRLAGVVNFGARTPRSADIQIDGMAGTARVTGNLLLDGGWSTWRTAPGDITLVAESANIALTLAALTGGDTKVAAQDFDPPRAGRFAIKALAGSSGGYLSNAILQSEGFEAKYDGTTKFAAEAGWQSEGDVQIRADDARIPLTLAGLRTGKGAGQVALAGAIKLTSNKSGQTFVLDGLQAGGSKISGRVALAANAEPSNKGQARSIDADLAVDSGSVIAMLALLTNETATALLVTPPAEIDEKLSQSSKKRRNQPQSPVPPSVVASEPSIWPAQSFDAGLFANLNGRIKATFGTLSIEPGLGLSEALVDVAITPGRIDVAHIDGKALGGTVTSALTLDKDPVGVKLAASFALKAGGAASSNAILKFDAGGRAASPAGLIADIKGKGELTLAEAALHVNSPAALTAVAEAALQGKGPTSGEELVQAVRTALRDSSQSLGGFSIPLTVGDGVVRFDKVRLDAAEGRSQFDAVIQLDSLKLASEWQIEPKVMRAGAPAERMTLAPVSIVYNGKLKDIATLEPEITVAALERELAVRKMERDVEELERLRKADQARAAAETERRNALEAERVRAAAAAKAARDAAAAANAAGFLAPQVPPQQGAAQQVAPQHELVTPGSMAPSLGTDQPVQSQGRAGGASAEPVEPSAIAAQGDSGPDGPVQGEITAPGSNGDGASNLGRPPSSWQPTVRKKRLLAKQPPKPIPAKQPWKPFQVTPY